MIESNIETNDSNIKINNKIEKDIFVSNIQTNIPIFRSLFIIKNKIKNLKYKNCKICYTKYKKLKKLKNCVYCKIFICHLCYIKKIRANTNQKIIICIDCKLNKFIYKKDKEFLEEKNILDTIKNEILNNLKSKETDLGLEILQIKKIENNHKNFINSMNINNKKTITGTLNFKEKIKEISNKIEEFYNFISYIDSINNNILNGDEEKLKLKEKVLLIEKEIDNNKKENKDLILNISFIINMLKKRIENKKKNGKNTIKKGYLCF